MDIQEITKQIVREARGEVVAVAYEGKKVEFQDETWYQLIISDHGGVYPAWYALIDGDAVLYERDKIAIEDRIDEIDEAIFAFENAH
ncbi:hypothetical protein SEA_RIE18_59 [Microbacterium phage Rie18]|nr:hypothetical protein SEA_RIE18_59 [Microbacterium phage Rie18]